MHYKLVCILLSFCTIIFKFVLREKLSLVKFSKLDVVIPRAHNSERVMGNLSFELKQSHTTGEE